MSCGAYTTKISDANVKKAVSCIDDRVTSELKSMEDKLEKEMKELKLSTGSLRKYQSTFTTDAEKAGFGGASYKPTTGNVYQQAKILQEQAKQCCDATKQDCTGKRVCITQQESGSFDFKQPGLAFYGSRFESYCPITAYKKRNGYVMNF